LESPTCSSQISPLTAPPWTQRAHTAIAARKPPLSTGFPGFPLTAAIRPYKLRL
jgi:hypothetical protein